MTFGPCNESRPYRIYDTLTLIVLECAPVMFDVILTDTVHCYRVICILARTCTRSVFAIDRSYRSVYLVIYRAYASIPSSRTYYGIEHLRSGTRALTMS